MVKTRQPCDLHGVSRITLFIVLLFAFALMRSLIPDKNYLEKIVSAQLGKGA